MFAVRIFTILFLFTISYLLFFYSPLHRKDNIENYWIWAGILPRDVPANNILYVYQGVFIVKEDNYFFKRKGLYPHPIKAKELYLVFRIEGGLPDPENFAKLGMFYIASWQKHKIMVRGIQLDFDSPTAKLLKYNEFLINFRKFLPIEYKLSITGLGDWVINGNSETLIKMSKSIDEMVFQLYQGRKSLPGTDFYVEKIAKLNFPFKAGFLINQPYKNLIVKLKKNKYYLGEIFFLQK